MTRPLAVRDHYERRLARAIEWGFTTTMTGPVDLSGFTGWVPFALLPTAGVPTEPGVYVVVRPSDEPPRFLDVSPAGHFKGKDPTVAVAELAALWVPGERVVYIGKANLGGDGKRHLRKRLD